MGFNSCRSMIPFQANIAIARLRHNSNDHIPAQLNRHDHFRYIHLSYYMVNNTKHPAPYDWSTDSVNPLRSNSDQRQMSQSEKS